MANGQLKVVKREGSIVDFDSDKIKNAVMKSVRATKQDFQEEIVDKIVSDVCQEIGERFTDFYPNVENIQDLVEKSLMREGLYESAKSYILYRNERKKAREHRKEQVAEKVHLGKLRVKKSDGSFVLFDQSKIRENLSLAAQGFENVVSVEHVMEEFIKNIYDGISTTEIEKATILSAVSFIERDPAYSFVSGRLFLQKLFNEVVGQPLDNYEKDSLYRESFVRGIQKGVEAEVFDKRLLDFDLEKLSQALDFGRDELNSYMSMNTLYERYFVKIGDRRAELPQSFWMRVAMGLALNEFDRNERAIEFYDVLSSLRFVSSTPTLFQSGTSVPQLSSCYVTTVSDDLIDIFKCYKNSALLSKWSGGVANDWSSLRSAGSFIKSVKINSQGVIPFLKIANDVTVAISRSGRRKGATCAYLETWHLDIEDFLDLRKNTGDERRRTHEMNTANWIPDLFMKRIVNNGEWTLFSPDETPDLHHLYGRRFEEAYAEYEAKAKRGEMKKFKTVSAVKLWRKMLSALFETGHPWIAFKDPCNVRSTQDHAGVVHSSNLCTEITLNTSEDEIAVCNLGSVNMEKHVNNGQLDVPLLEKTVRSAVRMLDNVIDINFYPVESSKFSNLKHRPIGLGMMGFQDALYKAGINFDSAEAIEFSDRSMETLSYYAILSSSELAMERGRYSSYQGSKWDRGIFPIDTIRLLEEERGMRIPVSRRERLDWSRVRNHVREHGMRNSNVMAIAPTATISTISGCYPCIEPIYKNIYVKSNMTGEFTVVNPYLINDLKNLDLWNQEMLDQLKYYDGNVGMIAGIPHELKEKYKEVFDIDPITMIKVAAARGKWIDQSQALNVFMKGVSGRKLQEVYLYAWESGLKTTYYLRSLAASQIEKSTLGTKYGFTQKREYQIISPDGKPANGIQVTSENAEAQTHEIKNDVQKSGARAVDETDCEVCQ